MVVTLILGNGFDLNLGLKTSYSNFYKSYINQKTKNEEIKKMKESIGTFLDDDKSGQEITNWGDAELAFGEYSNYCDNSDVYWDCYRDIQDSFIQYLSDENNRFNENSIDVDKVLQSLNAIKVLFGINTVEVKINVISLNYTDTIRKIFNKVKMTNNKEFLINDILYIHGDLTNELTFGLGDTSQILNESIRKSLKSGIIEQIVKIRQDALTGRNNYQRLKNIFDTSDAIYSYGWSFGLSDLSLLQNVVEFVSKGKRLIFYSHGFIYDKEVRKSCYMKLFNDDKSDIVVKKLFGITKNEPARSCILNCVKSDCNNLFDNIKE